MGMDAVILLSAFLALAGPSDSDGPARVVSPDAPSDRIERSAGGGPIRTSGASSDALDTGVRPSSGSIDEDRPLNRATSPGDSGKPVRRGGTSASGRSLWPGLLALGGVLALIGVLTIVVRRLAPRVGHISAGQIEVVGRSFVSSKQSIALVRVGDRIVVVGICPESMSSLLVIDDPVEVGRLSVRTRGGSAAFERLVQAESISYGGDGAADASPRVRSALSHLLARVKTRVQQI